MGKVSDVRELLGEGAKTGSVRSSHVLYSMQHHRKDVQACGKEKCSPSLKSKLAATAVRFELTRVTPIDF